MSTYTSGSVNVTVGSQLVKGNNTAFNTYVSSGDLFRLNGETAFYQVAAITNATNLSLTANYANSNYGTGSTLTGRAYSVVRDYTTNYSIPEMGPNDAGISFIFTRAMRTIDSKMYNATCHTIKCASDIEVTASNRGVILQSQDGTPWRITVSNTGTVLTASNPT